MNKSVVISAKTFIVALLVVVSLNVCAAKPKGAVSNKLAGKVFVQQYNDNSNSMKSINFINFKDNKSGSTQEYYYERGEMTPEVRFTYTLNGDYVSMSNGFTVIVARITWLNKYKFKLSFNGKVETYALKFSCEDETSPE